MKKVFTHALFLSVSFFGMWYLLGLIDFRSIFEIEELTKENEQKLGTLILDAVAKSNKIITQDSIIAVVEGMKKRICVTNGISDSTITVHIATVNDVNAFALPGRHLVIYSGLIEYCKSSEELAGVIAHEIAHMEHDHVMKKMVKEVGLAMVISLSGGESGGEIVRQTVKLLSSTAFDREQESEADASGVHYLAKADIDPQASADFLFRLSHEKESISNQFELLNTHPNSADRAAEIIKLRKIETFTSRPISDSTSWKKFQESVRLRVGEKDLF
ncbi:MAG: M48 family metallopeptidase [Bacteroidota bacterium]|nr:M48 family metallopeptidase [Bacteroidota bacterium]